MAKVPALLIYTPPPPPELVVESYWLLLGRGGLRFAVPGLRRLLSRPGRVVSRIAVPDAPAQEREVPEHQGDAAAQGDEGAALFRVTSLP
jgi:hypothetical protein